MYLTCVSFNEIHCPDFLLYLAKSSTIVDHCRPLLNLTFDFYPRTLTFDLLPWPQNKLQDKKISCHNTFSQFDLDLWPTTLTYNPNLAKVKVDPHAKNEGHRSNISSMRGLTDRRADRRTDTTKRIIYPASQSIKRAHLWNVLIKAHVLRGNVLDGCWQSIHSILKCKLWLAGFL